MNEFGEVESKFIWFDLKNIVVVINNSLVYIE